MSRRKPKAHLYVDGGGMVTGTHDIALARRLLVAAHLEAVGYAKNPADDYGVWARPGERRRETAFASRMFQSRKARLETGRIVPNPPPYNSEYIWFWRNDYELGKPGVTRAVVWTP